MDRDQHELRFLGFLGVCRETSKTILKWRKVFAMITLALIVPLCVIFLAHSEVLQLLSFRRFVIGRDDIWEYKNLWHMPKKEHVALWLINLAYSIFFFTSFFVFSLLSTSAVVYAVACIHAAKQVTSKKVTSVVARVWKRLVVTFLWSFATYFAFLAVALGLLVATLVVVRRFAVSPALGIAAAVLLLIFEVIGFVYITMIWKLASVISVLEDVYGRKAMVKSKRLMKGKMGVSAGYVLGVLVCSVVVQALYEWALRSIRPVEIKIGVGLICLLLLSMVVLFDLVVQTVIYFVCKSYHHESIDTSCFYDHLEVSLEDCPSEAQKTPQLEPRHV